MPTTPPVIRGTQGYSENSTELIARYDSLTFAYKHSAVLGLLPAAPCAALDIGAGTGSDAAWLAEQGYRVVAVEPTDALREYGVANHVSPQIEWVNDSLPLLVRISRQRHEFSLVMLTAVWMHLDEQERHDAMGVVSSLLAWTGTLVMTLRHGPVPSGRIMFDVSANETIALAKRHGLNCILNIHDESKLAANRDAGISWSRLAFRRSGAS